MVVDEFVVVLTTLPAGVDAETLARELVEARVAACVNVLPEVRSIYEWDESVQVEREQQLIIKTAQGRVSELWTALRSRHPYDTPEFVVLPIVDGNADYLDWLRRQTAVKNV